MNLRAALLALLAASMGLAGCLESGQEPASLLDAPPYLAYEVPEPDLDLELIEQAFTLPGAIPEVELYVRVVRPAGDGPFPVIAQFTPYTAPGQNPTIDALMEPAVGCQSITVPGVIGLGSVGQCEGRFDHEFVRRGYAFAYGDVRGTGDSTGCLDLRGDGDIADLWHFSEWLGTQEWSTGKVGFIGGSYPGSEAHMAAISGNEHVAAVVPVVASTSFYHYHHNDGVPYAGQHSLGGTNAGYTQEGVTPTLNPETAAAKISGQGSCPHVQNAVMRGGMDQTGTYDAWWAERNLRDRAANITVPVLMAQGLADWNVKPDHIAQWFNDLPGAAAGAPKTLIAGQWGHAYPADEDGAYGDWWPYATAFFDTFLKGVETGMFQTDVAWVQDNDDNWHRSATWPLHAGGITFGLHPEGKLAEGLHMEPATESWNACPRAAPMGTDRGTLGSVSRYSGDGRVPPFPATCEGEEIVFETAPFEQDVLLSGVGLLNITVRALDGQQLIHLVAELAVVGSDVTRENYGYLNPIFRSGLDDPQPIGTEPLAVTIDLYPQEDVVKKGESLRLTLRSHDDGRTIESFDEGAIELDLVNASLFLPTRPADLQGVRLG